MGLAETSIRRLDGDLARRGTTITFMGGTATLSAVPAFVRGYDAQSLPAGITQAALKVIVSPTHLGSWVVAKGDFVVVAGETDRRSVLAVAPLRIGDDIVRYELTVRG